MPNKEPPANESAAAEEAEFPVTLDEYCARKSQGDRRVELIGAFHASEKASGAVKDLASKFEARFEEFVNKPV